MLAIYILSPTQLTPGPHSHRPMTSIRAVTAFQLPNAYDHMPGVL